jgi:hypothetical protein
VEDKIVNPDFFEKYIISPKTRRGVSIVCFIACFILFLDFMSLSNHTAGSPTTSSNNTAPSTTNEQMNNSIIPPGWLIATRTFSVGTFISIALINYKKPYITAEVKSYKCSNCDSEMATTELICQNCKGKFIF